MFHLQVFLIPAERRAPGGINESSAAILDGSFLSSREDEGGLVKRLYAIADGLESSKVNAIFTTQDEEVAMKFATALANALVDTRHLDISERYDALQSLLYSTALGVGLWGAFLNHPEFLALLGIPISVTMALDLIERHRGRVRGVEQLPKIVSAMFGRPNNGEWLILGVDKFDLVVASGGSDEGPTFSIVLRQKDIGPQGMLTAPLPLVRDHSLPTSPPVEPTIGALNQLGSEGSEKMWAALKEGEVMVVTISADRYLLYLLNDGKLVRVGFSRNPARVLAYHDFVLDHHILDPKFARLPRTWESAAVSELPINILDDIRRWIGQGFIDYEFNPRVLNTNESKPIPRR